MTSAETLLAAIEAHPSSVREGADSLALLYKWRRDGGDGAGFMSAMELLHAQKLVEILPGEDMRLRLTVDGFTRMDTLLPVESVEPEATGAEAEPDEDLWQGGAASARETPAQELAKLLLEVFSVLAVPPGHAVSADTLSKIWTMEGKRGGDLRTALDALSANGALVIHRGEQTFFTLTEEGSQAAEQMRSSKA